jgi:hypothetical protein
MPKVSDIFPAQFLRGAELTAPRDITIAGWRTEYQYGKEEYILDLVGESSALRCGPTLAREIAATLGDDEMDHWPGRTIAVYGLGMKIKDRDTGTEKDVIAIHAMASKLDKPPGNGKALSRPSDMDDDIPF